jgi:WD40 repeat protein
MLVGERLTVYADQNKPGEIWSIALSADGQYLASSSINGKVNVWSLNKEQGMPRIREYETKGSFGLCVDLVSSTYYSYFQHLLDALLTLY